MNLQHSRILTVAGLMALAASAQAHPGHEPLSQGATHFFTSPYHMAAGLLVGAGIWFAGTMLKGRAAKMAVRTVGAAVALGSLALWGIQG